MKDFACPQTFICPMVFALFLMTTQLAVTQMKKADKLMQSHKKSIINIKQEIFLECLITRVYGSLLQRWSKDKREGLDLWISREVSSTSVPTKQTPHCLYSHVVVTRAAPNYLHQSPLLLQYHCCSCGSTLKKMKFNQLALVLAQQQNPSWQALLLHINTKLRLAP